MKHPCRRLGVLTLGCTLALTLPAAARGSQETAAVEAFSKNGPATDAISFSAADFRVTGGAALSSIVIDTLPDPNAGVLTIGGQSLPMGSQVSVTAVDGLRFTPLSSPMLSATDFTFTPVFSDGQTGEAVTVGLFLLAEENSAPVAQAIELQTYKNVEVCGTFSGVDPDGDTLTYKLLSKPARGAVTQAEEGSAAFVYTPYENKTGRDAFTYVAVDPVGNTSAPATVSIRIEKQKSRVCYADMAGVPGHREAVRLAETGLLVGEQMGERYFFHPDQPVSRAQFTALAMSAAQVKALEGVTLTGFADDAAMDAWAKPFVSSALKCGLIAGSLDAQGQVVFQADEAITAAEAAVILDRALNVTDVADAFAAAPAWASQSASNLASCGVLAADARLDAVLTRADAARLLSGALDVMAQRDSGWWPW